MALKSEPIFIVRPDDTYHYGPGFTPYYYKDELDTAKGACMSCAGVEIMAPSYTDERSCFSNCTHVIDMGACTRRGRKDDECSKRTITYKELKDKPQINDVVLEGNKTFEDLGAYSITDVEIENIIDSIV